FTAVPPRISPALATHSSPQQPLSAQAPDAPAPQPPHPNKTDTPTAVHESAGSQSSTNSRHDSQTVPKKPATPLACAPAASPAKSSSRRLPCKALPAPVAATK